LVSKLKSTYKIHLNSIKAHAKFPLQKRQAYSVCLQTGSDFKVPPQRPPCPTTTTTTTTTINTNININKKGKMMKGGTQSSDAQTLCQANAAKEKAKKKKAAALLAAKRVREAAAKIKKRVTVPKKAKKAMNRNPPKTPPKRKAATPNKMPS
jgi:hypothetical protein